MKKFGWILLCVLLAALIGGAAVLYNKLGSSFESQQLVTQATEAPEETALPGADETMDKPESSETQPEPVPAPDFTVVDGDGNAVKLSDFFGKPIVLNFWASWCGPCKSEMPDFNEAYLELGEDIQFLMVNMTDGGRETLELAKAFVEKEGYSFPVYYDVNFEAAIAYGVSSLPTTYFLDETGSVAAYGMGALDEATLQKGIGMITE